RLKNLQLYTNHHILDAHAILCHVQRLHVGFERRQAFPLLDDDGDVFAQRRLHGNAARNIDSWTILDTSCLGAHHRHDAMKLCEESLALARFDFDGGEDVDHGLSRDVCLLLSVRRGASMASALVDLTRTRRGQRQMKTPLTTLAPFPQPLPRPNPRSGSLPASRYRTLAL